MAGFGRFWPVLANPYNKTVKVLKQKLQDISLILRFWLVLATTYDKIVKVLKEKLKILVHF